MITIQPRRGYQSEIAGVLDMVARGCARFMREGGGPLPQEQTAGKLRGPRRALDGKRVRELAALGYNQAEIGHIMQKPHSTIYGYISRHNLKRVDGRK